MGEGQETDSTVPRGGGLTGCGTLSVQVEIAGQTNTERAVTWQSSQGRPTRNSIAFW